MSNKKCKKHRFHLCIVECLVSAFEPADEKFHITIICDNCGLNKTGVVE